MCVESLEQVQASLCEIAQQANQTKGAQQVGLPFQVSRDCTVVRAVTAAGGTNADDTALGIKFVAAVQSSQNKTIDG